MPVVTDVLVSASSTVAVTCEGVSSDSGWEFVEPQSFLFSKKASSLLCGESRTYELSTDASKKTPLASRRRMMPALAAASLYPSIEATRWLAVVEDQGIGWNARDRTVIAKLEKYLNESDCLKLEIEELELLLGPEDSEVHLRHILRNGSRRGGRIFEIFSSKEKSKHLVASKVRWDERQRLKAMQEEKARRDVQEVDDEVDQNWATAYEWTARKMLKYLEGSEA